MLLGLSLSAVFYLWPGKHKIQSIDSIQVLESTRSLCFLPQYIALEKGFFKEQNLEVELKTAHSLKDTGTAIKNQTAAFILCGAETLVNYPAQDSGGPVAIAALTSREGSFLLGRKERNGFTWEDVKGNSIIVDGPDSLQSMLLENILRQKAIGPNYDVNIIQNLPDYLRRGVFKSGTASFIVLSEPEVTLAEKTGEGRIVTSLGVEGKEIPAAVLVSNRQFLTTHPKTAQKYTNAIYKAQLWMQYHNTRETVALIKDYFPQVEQKVLISAIERYQAQETWSHTPVIPQANYDRLVKIMDSSGELVGQKNYKETVANQFAQESVNNVTYKPEEKKKRNFPFSLWEK